MKAYVDGKPIGEIPALADVYALPEEQWFPAFIDWIARNRPGAHFQVIVGLEALSLQEAQVLEMWVPSAPFNRATEIGGVLKTYSQDRGPRDALPEVRRREDL